jgi:phage-related protein
MDWLSKLTPEQQKMVVIVLAIVAAIGPLLTMLGGVVTAVGALTPVFTGIAGVLSGPVLLAIGLVIAVIAALYYAWTNNIGGIQEKTAAVLAWLQTAFTNIVAFVGRHGTEITGLIKGAYDTVANIVALAFTTVTGILQAGYQLLTGDTKGAMETIKGTISVAWTLIQGVFGSAKTTILNLMALLWDTTVSGARDRLAQVKQTIIDRLSESMDYLRSLPKLMWDLAANMVQGLIDGIKARGDQVGATLLEIIRRAVKNFTDFLGIKSPSRVFIEQGMQMMRGLEIGIDRFGHLPQLSLSAVGTSLASGPVDGGEGAGGRGETHLHFHDVHVRKDEDIDAITRKVLARMEARR